MFCPNCEKEIDDKAVICVGCGVPVVPAVKPFPTNQPKKLSGFQITAIVLFAVEVLALFAAGLEKAGAVFYGIGFMIPAIVGFVLLFLDYRGKANSHPSGISSSISADSENVNLHETQPQQKESRFRFDNSDAIGIAIASVLVIIVIAIIISSSL